MQSAKHSAGINCPIHPSEPVQRVNVDLNATQQLYCMECILSQDDSTFDRSTLKSIAELIDMAAKHYQLNKDKANIASDVPPEFIDSLAGQAESLEGLTKHLEIEKKKVEHVFDMITKEFLRVIEDKKNEYLFNLDQQLFNLRYWYIFFDKQIKKAYPTPDDISFLFPTKENLNNKLEKISNSTQLMAFVRNLKEDLNEGKLIPARTDQKTFLNTLKTELVKIENAKPVYNTENSDVSSVRTELKQTLENSLDQLLVLENPIKDVIQGRNYDSKILKAEQFELLKSWMPKDYKFDLKLLYRGTRDGMDGNSFQKLCVGKGATITIIKCRFGASTKDSIIGGFLGQSWTSNGQYINCSKAFLFSVTKKIKCAIQTTTYAGYGNAGYGPSFGSGHDLALFAGGQNYVNAGAYANTLQITEQAVNNGSLNYFKPSEVEVYLVK